MIYIKQDITTLQAPAIIAHGVNCSNAMGSGVARALFEKWPEVKTRYHTVHPQVLGDVQFVEVGHSDIIVANCFTQQNYGRSGERYADPKAIAEALTSVASYAINVMNLTEIHMPKIGCGLGGLNWETDVEPLLQEVEASCYVTITVCDV